MEFLTKSSISNPQTKINGLMDQLAKLSECTICKSFFKTPVELKCGHIFCKGCLKRGTENVLNVSCPTCKGKTLRRALHERNDIKEITSNIRQIQRSFSEENKRMETKETSQTQPLDLSLKRPLELCNQAPKRCSAIKFIKPLDLTCNQKIKCDPKRNILTFHDITEENSRMKIPIVNTSSNENNMEIDLLGLKMPKTNNSANGEDMEIDLIHLKKPKAFNSTNEEALEMDLIDLKNPKTVNSTNEEALEMDLIDLKKPKTINSTNEEGLEMDLIDLKKSKTFNSTNEKAIEMDMIDLKNPKAFNSTHEKAMEIDRNDNQTEETCYEMNDENEDSETSDSEVSVLAETPVKETDSKRKSLRDIHSVVTKPCPDVKNTESSVESEPTIVPLPSKNSYINRQNECSEIPSGMFDLSFDKLEEIQQIGRKIKCPTPTPPPIDILSSASSTSQSLLSPRFVFCPTRLSKPQVLQLQKLCDICNGTIVKLYSDDVTHLIINLERGRVPQTVKYLFAIAGKKWVVTFGWVYKCIQEGKMVSEEPFETSNFQDCDVGVKKSRLATVPLFKDFNFFIVGDMKSSGATVDECKKLLSQLGGNILVSAGEGNENVLIVGDLLDKSRTYEYWYQTKGLLTVSWEWILDCILTFSLVNFSKNHLITNLNGCGLGQAALPKALLNIRQV